MKAVLLLLLLSFTLANGDESSWAKFAPDQNLYRNIGPPPKPLPVYLSPFLSDGLSDPVTGLKSPVDLLDMIMICPKTEEAKRKLLKSKPLKVIQFIESPSPPPLFYNPRDKLLANMQNETKEVPERMWFDFAALQSKNLNRNSNVREPLYDYQKIRSRGLREREKVEHQKSINQKTQVNPSNIKKKENRKYNWTTCKEFKKISKFHPKNLLDVRWLPFYAWTDEIIKVAVVHKFSSAPKTMVVRMKQELGSRLTHNVDWNQYKLLMENVDKTLLIAADHSGLFYGIKDTELPEYFKSNKLLKYPVFEIRFKFVEQYVAMMYCDMHYATIMAALEDAPNTDSQKEKAANALKFVGKGFPVSRNLELERSEIEFRKAIEEAREEAKFVSIDIHENGMHKDKHNNMDLW